ncbi:hypothetical protein D3C81_1337340 [compost metagenome]
MTTAVSQREVQYAALPQLPQVQHRMPLGPPLVADEAGGGAFELGIQQHLDRPFHVHQVLLIHHVERLDALHQRVLRLSHLDPELGNRRMRGELGAQGRHEVRRPVRGVYQTVIQEAQDRVGPMQRVPAPSPFQPGAQSHLLLEAGDHLAGISHQEIGSLDGLEIRVILENPHPDALVLAQQLEQLQAGEVDVVVLAGRHQNTINSSCLFVLRFVALPHDFLLRPRPSPPVLFPPLHRRRRPWGCRAFAGRR